MSRVRDPFGRAVVSVFQHLASPWFLGVFVGFYAVLTVVVVIVARVASAVGRGPSFLAAMPTFLILSVWLFGMMLSLHVKKQFSAPRARLLPGFARAHLAAAGLWLSILIAVPFAGVAGLPGFPVMGTVAFFTALAALCVWIGIVQAVGLNIAATLGFILLMNRPLWVQGLIADTPPVVAAAALVLSAAALAAAARWLTRLHEEVPAYHREWGMRTGADLHAGRARAADAATHNPRLSRYATWLMRPRWLPPRRATLREPFLREVRRLMAVDMPRRASWVSALMFVVLFSVLTRVGEQPRPETFLPLLVVLPVTQLSSMWHARASGFGQELMRPVERSRFFGQLAAAWLAEMSNAWLALHVAGVALVLLTWPDARFWLTLAFPALAASAAGNAFLLANALYWVPRARSGQAAVFALVVLTLPLSGWLGVTFCGDGLRTGWLVGGLIALPLLSVAIAGSAYRRWLRADV